MNIQRNVINRKKSWECTWFITFQCFWLSMIRTSNSTTATYSPQTFLHWSLVVSSLRYCVPPLTLYVYMKYINITYTSNILCTFSVVLSFYKRFIVIINLSLTKPKNCRVAITRQVVSSSPATFETKYIMLDSDKTDISWSFAICTHLAMFVHPHMCKILSKERKLN